MCGVAGSKGRQPLLQKVAPTESNGRKSQNPSRYEEKGQRAEVSRGGKKD